MNVWIIVAVALAAICCGLAAVCIRQQNQLRMHEADAQGLEGLRRALNAARYEVSRRRRENAALHRALEAEQRRSDGLERELESQLDRIADAEHRAAFAETRRIQVEKNISAGQMKASLLEKKLEEMEKEQLAQEQLYQDILREREETISKFQEAHSKHKPRRKPDALDQQITLNDLLKGM